MAMQSNSCGRLSNKTAPLASDWNDFSQSIALSNVVEMPVAETAGSFFPRTMEFLTWYRKSNCTLPSPSNKCMKVKDMSREEVLEKIREEKKRIEDLSCLNVIAGDRGFVIGPFTFKLDGRSVDCNSEFGPDNKVRVGQVVLPYISSVSDMKNNGARFVLVVESVSAYQRLTGDNFHNDYKCIIMTGKGMSDLALREFAKYIMDTFEIPIFLLSDSDSWGIEIYAVFKYGSESMAFDSENLANPLVHWLGVWPTDLTTLKIPSERLSCDDLRKARKLLKEFVTSDEMLVNQLDHMIMHKEKAGILALNNFGPLYGLSDYLLYKLYKVGDIMKKGKL
ncbi:DNA topoisomerase 6 subunit A-like [Rosa rugosa]|uniref:DNA topoisomerase 6 subunit A-like n=1 Tax=Rosa rugosa TaxID=74645 RepID=UPI002B417C8B|nr:DNA topoisomerase 6 subunit A-like [Rosa rugosa]